MYPASYAQPGESSRAQQAVQALNIALKGPHGCPYTFSSHYAQAYMTQRSSPIPVTPCADVPGTNLNFLHRTQNTNYRGQHGRQNFDTYNSAATISQTSSPSHWYESGAYRCTYKQCSFMGSKKSVEVHMMDRHLIFPPGWEKRKRRAEWDADPSLKNGKPIPIQGTNIVLDTPQAVDNWIAERRRRFPTFTRIEEKKRRLQEAMDRGDVFMDTNDVRGGKRQKRNCDIYSQVLGEKSFSGNASKQAKPTIVHPLPEKPKKFATPVDCNSDSSSSGSDVDPVRDAISSKRDEIPVGAIGTFARSETMSLTSTELPKATRYPCRKYALRPKVSQRQISSRPYLLRKLLLPEIVMTVSNLSQAIHFLVENDFLENVELNPGDAEARSIEVVDGV